MRFILPNKCAEALSVISYALCVGIKTEILKCFQHFCNTRSYNKSFNTIGRYIIPVQHIIYYCIIEIRFIIICNFFFSSHITVYKIFYSYTHNILQLHARVCRRPLYERVKKSARNSTETLLTRPRQVGGWVEISGRVGDEGRGRP